MGRKVTQMVSHFFVDVGPVLSGPTQSNGWWKLSRIEEKS